MYCPRLKSGKATKGCSHQVYYWSIPNSSPCLISVLDQHLSCTRPALLPVPHTPYIHTQLSGDRDHNRFDINFHFFITMKQVKKPLVNVIKSLCWGPDWGPFCLFPSVYAMLDLFHIVLHTMSLLYLRLILSLKNCPQLYLIIISSK